MTLHNPFNLWSCDRSPEALSSEKMYCGVLASKGHRKTRIEQKSFWIKSPILVVTRANVYHAIMSSGNLLPASSSPNIDISEHSSLHPLNLKAQLMVNYTITLLTLTAVLGARELICYFVICIKIIYPYRAVSKLKKYCGPYQSKYAKVNNMFHTWFPWYIFDL